jgi:hypothetical protein
MLKLQAAELARRLEAARRRMPDLPARAAAVAALQVNFTTAFDCS